MAFLILSGVFICLKSFGLIFSMFKEGFVCLLFSLCSFVLFWLVMLKYSFGNARSKGKFLDEWLYSYLRESLGYCKDDAHLIAGSFVRAFVSMFCDGDIYPVEFCWGSFLVRADSVFSFRSGESMLAEQLRCSFADYVYSFRPKKFTYMIPPYLGLYDGSEVFEVYDDWGLKVIPL